MATEILSIQVREDGTRVVKRRIEDVAKTAERTTGTLGKLKTALFALGGGLLARELARTVNSFAQLQNRLRVVTGSVEELTTATDELFKISQRTRASFESTAELYSRVALASRDLGVNQEQLLRFTERLNKAIIVSGASATEARAGLIQLSQGLASGALRGDELRSVLEQLPAVADVIANSLGVTRGALRDLGAQGLITAEVVLDAFENAGEQIEAQFAQTVITLPQAFQVLQNSFVKTFGELDQGLGITQALSTAMIGLANTLPDLIQGMGELVPIVGALGAGFTVLKLQAALTGTGFLGLAGAARTALRPLLALNAAFLANPIGLFVAGIAALVTGLVLLRDRLKVTESGFATFGDLIVVTFNTIRSFVSAGIQNFKSFASFLDDAFFGTVRDVFNSLINISFNDFLRAGAFVVDSMIGAFKGLGAALGVIFKNIGPIIINGLLAPLDFAVLGIELSINKIIDGINSLGGSLDRVELAPDRNLVTVAADVGREVIDAFNSAASGQTGAQDLLTDLLVKAEDRARTRLNSLDLAQGEESGLSDALERGNELLDKRALALQDVNRELDNQARFLALSNREREVESKLVKIEEGLRTKGVTLSEREVELFRERLQGLQVLQAQGQLLETVTGEQETLNVQVEAYNKLLSEQPELANQARAALLESSADLLQGTLAAQDLVVAQHERNLSRIQALREADVISEETANQARLRSANEVLEARLDNEREFFGTLAGLAKSGNAELATIGKAAAVTQATIDGFLAAQKALTLGPILGPIAAAAIGVQTAQNINGILSARALGGDLNAGQISRVGESSMGRPEMFTTGRGEQFLIPPERGRVEPLTAQTTPAQTQAINPVINNQPPNVEVKNINIIDQSMLAEILDTPEGEQIIINAISRNQTEFKQKIGLGDD